MASKLSEFELALIVDIKQMELAISEIIVTLKVSRVYREYHMDGITTHRRQ